MDADEPLHLTRRDRGVLAYRLVGAGCGLTLVVVAFATSSWENGWMIALFGLVTVGGAISYHLLTSVVHCPTCTARVTNFRISADDANRKLFLCRACGTSVYLTEGFYWREP